MGKSRRSSASTSSAASEAASSTAVAASHSMNLVEKLSMLRQFVSSQWTESDLTDCLQQCSYNVELAAEKLMTGQYTSSKKKPKKRRGSSFFLATKASPTSTSASATSTATTSSLHHQTAQKVNKITPASTMARRHKRKDPPLSWNSPDDIVILDDNDAAHDASTRNLASTSFAPQDAPSHHDLQQQQQDWQLCNRWLSDGVCLRSNGRTSYQEPLAMTASFTKNGSPMLSFRGKAIEGRLSEQLAAMLAPLLKPVASSAKPDSSSLFHQSASTARTKKKQAVAALEYDPPLIRLECHALMEDSSCPMGSHIPISVTVWIIDARRFFQLFDTRQERVPNLFLEKQRPQHHSHNATPLARAAWNLLQWAEYGDVPTFQAQNANTTNDDPIVEDDEHDPSSLEELQETDFEEAASVASTDQGIAWSTSVAQPDPEWARTLPEAADPVGFSNRVTLRPYQKQALHWMRAREVDGAAREEMEDQLALLSELADQQSSSSLSIPQSQEFLTNQENQPSIICDRGPVRLTTQEARQHVQTLTGQVNPLSHPLWKRRYLASSDCSEARCFYVNELMGIASHTTPPVPTPCSGGILADAMGLGKTVMLMALILQRKAELAQTKRKGPRATLVIAKLSLLPQWEEEIRSKTNLTYHVYYGGNGSGGKSPSLEELAKTDVVITTYGTIQGESKRKNPVLSKISWLRIVLDEAHCVKNTSTLASKVCCALQAKHRWCVSGTIIQNSLDDVYGILKFLHHEPWCMASFWKTAITKPLLKVDDSLDNEDRAQVMDLVLSRIRRVLSPMMLRRTKDSLDKDGKPILSLPPVEAKTITVQLSQPEREFYDALLARSSELFDGFVDSGMASKSYFQIFTLLVRLRQACDHISLTVRTRVDADEETEGESVEGVAKSSKKSKLESIEEEVPRNDALGSKFLNDLYSKFFPSCSSGQKASNDNGNDYVENVANALSAAVSGDSSHVEEECPICLECPLIEDAVLTPCAHIFCKTCLVNYLKENAPANGSMKKFSAFHCPNGKCPLCNSKIDASKIVAMAKSNDANEKFTTHFLTSSKPVSSKELPAAKREIRDTQEGNASASARLILEDSLQQGGDSSKIVAVMKELDAIWKLDPGSKVIIFSQFLGFLDLMETKLGRESIPYFRLDGKLSLNKRMEVLEDFRSYKTENEDTSTADNHRGSVLLMSMGAGGEGLNLVAASSVFIVDPWWNNAKEDQCINRIHRIGQLADQVRVRKFVVENSVEERIVELQQRKKHVADEVYNGAGSGDGGGARLKMEDFRLIFQKMPEAKFKKCMVDNAHHKEQAIPTTSKVIAVLRLLSLTALLLAVRNCLEHRAGFRQWLVETSAFPLLRSDTDAVTRRLNDHIHSQNKDPANKQNRPQSKAKPDRILYIVTSLTEFDNGKRATKKGHDRFSNTLLPILRESAWSMRQLSHVDVVLITHYNMTDRHLQALDNALKGPPKGFQSVSPDAIPYEVWPEATPIAYKMKQRFQRTDKLEPHYRGLSRQHRFVIKDKWQHYDMFVAFEDDMLLHKNHVLQYWKTSQQLYKLRLEAPATISDECTPKRTMQATPKRDDCFYGKMTQAQLKRTMPGLFRVEAALAGWNRSALGHYEDNLYSQIPVDLRWSKEDGQNEKTVSIDPAPCCHVWNSTANDHIPKAPTAHELYFWETSIDALGIRRMPQSKDHPENNIGWALLQMGGFDQMGMGNAISDYWSGLEGHFQERPNTLKGRYGNNQGGWMATKRQLIEWHTEHCQRGFLPPFPADNVDPKGMTRPRLDRQSMYGGFQYDGLGYEAVEHWSGGQQIFGVIGCNMKRIIPLKPTEFANLLIYHSSNNKQRHGTVQHRFSSHNIEEFYGQLNSVRRAASKYVKTDD